MSRDNRLAGAWMFLLSLSLSAAPASTPQILRVYHHRDYPPLEYRDRNGKSDGFDVQIFEAVAKAAGLNYTISGVGWDSLRNMIHSGDFDVLTGIYFRISDKQKLDFSIPILSVSYSLFVPVNSDIISLHDNVEKRVIIVGGGVSLKLVDDIFSIRDVIQVNNVEQAIALLESGTYDCAVLPTLQANYHLHSFGIKDIIATGPPLLSRNLCFAVPAGDSALINSINTGLQIIQANGKYAELLNKWVEPYFEQTFSWRFVKKYLLIFGTILAIAVIGIIIWTTALKQAVKSRTRELHRESSHRKKIADQLAESNDLKALLIDIITHDLKNPAAVINGMADLMLSTTPDDEMLGIVKQGSTNLLNVIENATTLSNVTLGEEIQKQPLSVKNILEAVAHEFNPSITRAGMSLEIEQFQDVSILANPIVSEVFKNYLSNAVKYATRGKKIIIAVTRNAQELSVTVSDFGKTIPEEFREKVFERSFQIDKTAQTGRGLGLAIVRRIAAAHNAKVGVRPNSPTGNVFYFDLNLEPVV